MMGEQYLALGADMDKVVDRLIKARDRVIALEDAMRAIIAANNEYLAENPNAKVERDPVTLACDAASQLFPASAQAQGGSDAEPS